MTDLLIELTDLVPVARRVMNQQAGWPWGDGIVGQPSLFENGAPNACHPVSPGRNPSKWPNNLDYRDPGFLPWSQRTATPSPAGYRATFNADEKSSPWPDPKDDGKTVYLFPSSDPSESSRDVTWHVQGLAGGELEVDCSYVSHGTPGNFPGGSLRIQSFATTLDANEDPIFWSSPQFKYQTWLQYSGPHVYWGPLPVKDLRSDGTPLPSSCGACAGYLGTVRLPDFGIASGKPGGDFVARINGATLISWTAGDQCYFLQEDAILLPDATPDFCGTAEWNALYRAVIQWDTVNTGVLSASLYYGTSIGTFGVPCIENFGVACCNAFWQTYGFGPEPNASDRGYQANYRAFLQPGDYGCQEIPILLNSVTFEKDNENGNPWAGLFPQSFQVNAEEI